MSHNPGHSGCPVLSCPPRPAPLTCPALSCLFPLTCPALALGVPPSPACLGSRFGPLTCPALAVGVRGKPGTGYGYGGGVRVDSPLGPLRLEYAWNDKRQGRFHVGLGYD